MKAMARRLAGKTVLVSGATGALGESVTRALLAEGAQMAGIARSWPKLPDDEFLPLVADLTLDGAGESAVRWTLKRFGRLDAAIHLMGGFAGGKNVQETRIEDWDQMMNLNLRSAFLLFRAALPPLLENKSGRLIAVGSRAGATPMAGLSAYGVSKAALHALVQTLAVENQHTGITANAVLPGTIDTPANRAAMPKADTSKWVTPASIAELIVWLASDASADVNGALIPIYGRS